jgi:hypothetical protein
LKQRLCCFHQALRFCKGTCFTASILGFDPCVWSYYTADWILQYDLDINRYSALDFVVLLFSLQILSLLGMLCTLLQWCMMCTMRRGLKKTSRSILRGCLIWLKYKTCRGACIQERFDGVGFAVLMRSHSQNVFYHGQLFAITRRKKKFHGNIALAYININARKRDISNKLNLYMLKNGIHVIKLKEYLKHASK